LPSTLSLRSSLNVSDQFSHPYRTTGIVTYNKHINFDCAAIQYIRRTFPSNICTIMKQNLALTTFIYILSVILPHLNVHLIMSFRPTSYYVNWHNVSIHTYLSMKMELTECSEASAFKIQTPGNYPGESIQQVGITFTTRVLSYW
jgi:hypothetical protein